MTKHRTSLTLSTVFNLSGLLVPILVQLATVPLYIHVIGPERYGIMALFWLLLGYFGVFDLGFGRAIASSVAALPEHAAEDRQAVFWTGTCLSIMTGLVGGLILAGVGQILFGDVFKVASGFVVETHAALPLLILALPLVTGISALPGGLQGREAFAALNISQLTGSILYQIFPLAVAVLISPTLPGLVLAAILGRAASFAMLYIFCLKRVPASPMPCIVRSEIRPLLGYGGWVTLTGLISPLLTVFDRFVIGAITGMTAVTAYTIPYNLVMRIAALPSAMQTTLFPRFAMLDRVEAQAIQLQAVRLVACVMTPFLVITIVFMKLFLSLWLGPALAEQAVPVGQILALGLWPNAMAFIPFGYLQSRGRPDLPAKFHVAELLAYAPLLWVLTKLDGVAGAAWAWDARALADALLLSMAALSFPALIASSAGFPLVMIGFVLAIGAHSLGYWY